MSGPTVFHRHHIRHCTSENSLTPLRAHLRYGISRSARARRQHVLSHSVLGEGKSDAAQIDVVSLSAADYTEKEPFQTAKQTTAEHAQSAAPVAPVLTNSAASAAQQLTQRLVWASAAVTLASFASDVLAGAGGAAAQVVGSGWLPWLVSLHGAFAFTTLTVVFSEDYELPAVAVHAVGAVCSLALLWQAAAAAQMPMLPLRLALAAAFTSAAVNARHFRARNRQQPPVAAAQRLRQWLRFLGCVGMGLLWQAVAGRVAEAGVAALVTAGVTLAVNSRAEGTTASQQRNQSAATSQRQEAATRSARRWAAAQRLWANWPALSATLLLMLDAAAPLTDPAAAAASAALLPTILAVAANALLIPRALAIPNTMFLTAVSFGTAANWAALVCKAAYADAACAAAAGPTTVRMSFVVVSMVLLSYIAWVRRLHDRVCGAEFSNKERSGAR